MNAELGDCVKDRSRVDATGSSCDSMASTNQEVHFGARFLESKHAFDEGLNIKPTAANAEDRSGGNLSRED